MQFVPGAYIWARRLATLLFPSCCLTCSLDVSFEDGPVCPACKASINIRPRYLKTTHIDHAISLAPFDGTLKELIHLYKYSGKDYLSQPLAHLILKQWPSCPFQTDAILPVPMPFWREVKRGYNQSFLLAQKLGQAWNRPIIKGGIQRKWNRSQTYLTREERLGNAAKGFRIKKSIRNSHKQVLIVDDVLTTGATLDTCARLLKKAGASRVSALTLAYD